MIRDGRSWAGDAGVPATRIPVALTLEEIGQVFLVEAMCLPGAQTAALVSAHEATMKVEIIATRGLPDATVTRMKHLRLDDPLPLAIAAATRTNVILPSRDAAAELGGAALTEFARAGIGSLIAVPLLDDPAVPGAMAVGFRDEHVFDAATVGLLMSLARLVAQAIAHGRANERAQRLQALTTRLSAVTTPDEVAYVALDHLARSFAAAEVIVGAFDDRARFTSWAQYARGDRSPTDLPNLIVPSLLDGSGGADVIMIPNGQSSTIRPSGTSDDHAAAVIALGGRRLAAVLLPTDRTWGHADRAELVSIGQIVIQARERADHFQDESDARDRAERLRAFAAQLAAAVTVADVASAVAAEGVRTLRAATAALALTRASGELEVAADVGGLLTGEPPFHVCASKILADVLSSAKPRFIDDVRAAGWRSPQAARFLATRGLSAAVILPLVVQGAALGVVVFAFDRPQKSDPARHGFLELIAGQAAQALERARLHNTVVRERAVHERARRRAEFAADLLASLDAADGTMRRIERLLDALVPDIADFASVELLDESGQLAVAAVRHSDPALEPSFEALRRQHSMEKGIVGSVANVAATGRPHLFELSPASADEYSLTPAARGGLGRLRPRSVMTLPLGPPGRRLGALLVGTSDSRTHAFDADDLAYFDVLSQQVGLSLDNAQLFERHRQVSLRLQESLLADSMPELPGLAVAAFYEPAAPDLEVGGDWCEAIELPDGRVGLFVGDVVGRGLGAAAAMGQLRAAVNALALTCETPARLIDCLALFAETIPAAHCATVVAALLDRHSGELVYACAAHPPPLVITADGDAHFLEEGRSVPLVVPSRNPRTDACVTLMPGTRLVLFSDGLVERRGESIDVGLSRLATAAGVHRRLPGNAFVAALVADLTVDQHRLDDIAVLCIDLATDLAVRFVRRFTTSPHELAGLRVAMRDWFAVNDIAAADANDILLAVGEAVANAVEHAYVPGASGDVEVELVRDGAQMTLRIRDRGIWNLLPAPGDRGRGLPLMRAVSDVDIRRSLSGTTVTMQRRLGRVD